MIIGWFLSILVATIDGMQSQIDAHGADFHFSQNNNILAVLSYMLQSNHFFPLETYFTISVLYGSVYGTLLIMRAIRVIYGAIPGGQKLEI